MLEHNGQRRVGVEWQLAGGQLIEHHAERVEVGAVIARLAQPLLRRHIGRGPDRRARGGVAWPGENLGDPEVGEDHTPAGVHHHVRGFDIAVDHVVLVSVSQRLSDLARDLDRGLERERLPAVGQAFEAGLERCAFDEFHDHVRRAALDVEVVDLHDVRMVERGHVLGFALEARGKAGVVGEEWVHHLDRDIAIQIGLERLVDLGHPAAAQALDDPVFPDVFTD